MSDKEKSEVEGQVKRFAREPAQVEGQLRGRMTDDADPSEDETAEAEVTDESEVEGQGRKFFGSPEDPQGKRV